MNETIQPRLTLKASLFQVSWDSWVSSPLDLKGEKVSQKNPSVNHQSRACYKLLFKLWLVV